MAPRTGRPKSDNPRTHIVPVRLTPDEKTSLETAAGNAGMSLSGYLRVKGLAAAKRARP